MDGDKKGKRCVVEVKHFRRCCLPLQYDRKLIREKMSGKEVWLILF